ncbi:hypothetical protein XENORESO_014370, partial [Xenotaenia resolanae]
EDGDQDGEGGDLEGSNNTLGSLPQISMGSGQMEPSFPANTSLDLNKQEEEGRPRRRRTPRFLLKP